MFSTYITRSGQEVTITGISSYFYKDENGLPVGKEHIRYSGIVNGQVGSWDETGEYSLKRVLGSKAPHELDLVSWNEEKPIKDPGIFYIEFKTKGNIIHARR